MAKVIVGANPFDMSSWDLSDLADGTVTSDTSTKVAVKGADLLYAITGTDLGSFDAHGFPQSGTVTGLIIETTGHVATKFQDISISASDFMAFVNGNDSSGLETALFSGNDAFKDGSGNDVLLGLGGNDTFNMAGGGDDTVSGGDGNDHFSFGAAFTAADSVDGGAGSDEVVLSGDYSGGVVFGAATMVNVETVSLAAGHSYDLTLNAASDTSGQSLEIYGLKLLSTDSLTLDGSAVAGSLRLVGGAGNDTLIGGSGDDVIIDKAGTNTFDLSAGGDDSVRGGTGNDTFLMGAALSSGDRIDGLGGTNTVVLNGDYSAGFEITGTEIKNVQTLQLAAGHSYNLSTNASLTTATIDGSALGASDSLTFDGSANATAVYTITGGAGNDVLTGNNAGDAFDLSHGGNDTVTGGSGNDVFDFGGAFTAADTVNGGSGSDQLVLNGDYSAGLTIGAASMTNIETLSILGTFNDSITTNDANVAAGQTLEVFLGDNFIPSTTTLTFDGAAETDGKFDFEMDGPAAYVVTGGAGSDVFNLEGSSQYNAGDRFDGGGGYNTLALVNEYAPVTFNAHTMTNIQELHIFENSITTVDANVAAGQTLTVTVASGFFDGLHETDGTFDISGEGRAYGGQGDDTITLDGPRNYFEGSGGADQLTAEDNNDIFIYKQASDSTSATYDTIAGYNNSDKFSLPVAVTAVDAAVNTGSLSTASFDSDLSAAIGPSQLGAHDAVIFTPNSGTLVGDHFLVVDANGTAGYQAGEDFVILLDNATSLNLTTANFNT